VIEADFFINMRNSSNKPNQSGSWSKTCQDFSIATKEKISKSSYKHWTNSGMAFRGECLTLNTSEHPKDADVCILSEVLEASAPAKCFLTPPQINSLLHRAKTRKKPLPANLQKALESQISLLSNTHQLGESQKQGRKQKATETTEKHTHSTPGEAQTLFVRRLQVSECEKLQGFPTDWTAID
jgi:hypothetical protein